MQASCSIPDEFPFPSGCGQGAPGTLGWPSPGSWDSGALLGWEAGPTPAVARPPALPAVLGVGPSGVWLFRASAQIPPYTRTLRREPG